MDTQAFTQAPIKAPATLAGHEVFDTESPARTDEWTVDDVVRSIRATDGARHRARRWAAAVGALVIAAAATATVGLSGDRFATSAKPAALPSRIAAAAAAGPATSRAAALPAPGALPSRLGAAATHHAVSRSRSVIVVMPADQDYLSAASIPVAGIALGRPHGPRIRSVHVALYVGGRLVSGADLEVYAGRFAGVLGIHAAIDQADAELRFSDPANPAQAAVVRSIRLDTPSTTR